MCRSGQGTANEVCLAIKGSDALTSTTETGTTGTYSSMRSKYLSLNMSIVQCRLHNAFRLIRTRIFTEL